MEILWSFEAVWNRGIIADRLTAMLGVFLAMVRSKKVSLQESSKFMRKFHLREVDKKRAWEGFSEEWLPFTAVVRQHRQATCSLDDEEIRPEV